MTKTKLPKLTEAIIRAAANTQSFQRGRELYNSEAISQTALQGNALSGVCAGTQTPFYKVRAELDSGGLRTATCTCPYNFDGYCKHIVALLLSYVHEPEAFAVRQEPAALLADLNREQLLALVTRLLKERPEMGDWIEAALATPAVSGAAKTVKRKPVNTDVYRRQVRSILHSSGYQDDWYGGGGLTHELESVQQTAREFLQAGDPAAALEILLAMADESQNSFDYVDDSDGELGSFFDTVGETMAEALLSMELDEERREDLVSDLDEIHSSLSNYGAEGLSVAIAAAQYGWNDLPQATPAKSAADDDEEDEDEDEDWEDDEDDDEYEASSFSQLASPWRRESTAQTLTRLKLDILERQGRLDEFLALCLRNGAHLRYALKLCELQRAPEAVKYALKHFALADDALQLAQWLRDAGQIEDAIKLGEQGLKLGGNKAALGEWLGPIEETQGRTAQALAAWQATFREKPSLAVYQTLQRLAGKRWKTLKSDLMAVLEKGYDKRALAEILLFEEEWDAAAKVAEANHYGVVEIVADALIPHRPEWVIRISKKHADELIAKTQSKLYRPAADWLKKAKAAYTQLGREKEWQKYLNDLKEEYRRRPALQAQLRGL